MEWMNAWMVALRQHPCENFKAMGAENLETKIESRINFATNTEINPGK